MYIHNTSRHRRSGTTMQKMPPRGELARYNRSRAVMPGYPATPFTDVEEIEAYLRDDRIDCLMCGQRFKTLLIHVTKIHRMDEGDYRARFNIPSKYVLAGQSTVAKLQENYHALDDDHAIKSSAGKRVATRAKGIHRPPVPMVGDSWRVGVDRMNSSPNKSSMKERISAARKERPAAEWKPDEHDWHLTQVRQHEVYRTIAPPQGQISWSGFKKRKNANPPLRAAFDEARRLGKADRALTRKKALADKRERHKTKMAEPRPHLRMHDDEAANEVIARIASGRTAGEVLSDDDMPSSTWFHSRMKNDAGLRQRFLDAIDALPFPHQARMGMMGPRFVSAVRSLRHHEGARLSDRTIGDRLGVTAMTVNKARRRHDIA